MILSETFLETLKDVGALREGHFQLASGRHSAHYVQVAQLSQHPALLQPYLEQALPDLHALGRIDTVFFPAIGALPVGQLLGLALKKRSVFSERDKNNTMQLRRGFTIHPGENVLLVEDVVTTGGTLKEILHMVEDVGAHITGVFCIINRSGESTWKGYPLLSLIDLDFPTYDPENLPPELAAIDVSRPGTKKVD